MYDVKLGKYYFSKSIVHDIDSALKLVCLIIYSVMMFLTNDIYMLMFLSIFLMLMIILSNVPIYLYISSIKILIPIIVFIFIINLIFKVDLIYTVISIFKLVSLILYSSLFMFTTTTKEMTNGIRKLLNPFRGLNINPNKIALSISLTIKFIPIILEQSTKILKSQSSRGLDFKNGNITEKIKSLNSLMVPMLMLSLKRADDIANFMEVRLCDIDNSCNVKSKYNIYDFFMLMFNAFIILVFIVGGNL